MKFTLVASDAFQKFQLNAGILTTQFDPTNPTVDRTKIFMATNGGASFSATHEFIDFAEDVDNVPPNTKEMKVLQSTTAVMSGTGKTVDTLVAKRLMAAADVDANGKITPRADLKSSDFFDLWWVGDYSNANVDDTTSGATAGFVAIKLINALSTGGFSLAPQNNGKADFAFEFTGHYSINDTSVIPYEVYIVGGTTGSDVTPTYTYSEVTPVGTENPANEGWYERSGTEGSYTYALTEDTTVDNQKTYYERNEA